MEKEEIDFKAHVLVLPYPAQGHINPMLQFSKRLVSKGVKATLANTIAINKSMHADPASKIDIETYSDGFDEGGFQQAESTDVYLSTLKLVGSKTLSDLIKRLKDSGRPVSTIIYDGFMPWAYDVAKQFGLLKVLFFTQSCAVNNVYYHIQRGLLPLPVPGPTVSLPGLPLLHFSDISSFVSNLGSYPDFFNLVQNQFRNIDEAHWVLFNSFNKMEAEVVDWMAKRWRLGTIGPTLPSIYLDKRLEDDKDYEINLFKPDTSTCMNWLQDKPSGSVVYVSFGSMAELGAEQMEELACGLKASNCYFLWVVRASEKAKLPKNFIEETWEKSLVISWCPQLQVLAHKATGCFLTHCGFNSWECLNGQINPEDVWKIGIRAQPEEKGMVRREVVELCIREVMEGDKGKEIKENANRWKNLATEAIDEGGSSDKNIDEFIAQLIN
ncbi:hypothetical protein P3X46_011987 [Hevea brasiliensis]|uniref:Glycosyltransferase n=1 Tax=Hevea brasiliensis TaxID=3981 RepID=A0ABQ9M8T7_HEVBR|nr:hypothetical protein P3X46_011987 [Hevea brasiliensis]